MAKVDPVAKVNVAPTAGCVIVTRLIVVAVAAPKTGVVSVGDVKVLLVSVSYLVLQRFHWK